MDGHAVADPDFWNRGRETPKASRHVEAPQVPRGVRSGKVAVPHPQILK